MRNANMKLCYKSKLFNIEGMSEDDHIYKDIVESKTFYEIDLLEYILKIKSLLGSKEYKHSLVVDVGANIGNHSVFFGAFVADHIIAVEPNPDVLSQLRRNLSKNIKDFTIYDCAVGDKKGRGDISLPQDMVNNVGAARIDLTDGKGEIEIQTLDSVLSSWQKDNKPSCVSLLKIDVEGMELQVLKGATNIISNHKPDIFTEAATSKEFNNIYNYLRPYGYKKMPGKWASTPVYHFVHKPVLINYIFAYMMQLKRIIIKIARRIKLYLTK